jgi:hypothetical protein
MSARMWQIWKFYDYFLEFNPNIPELGRDRLGWSEDIGAKILSASAQVFSSSKWSAFTYHADVVQVLFHQLGGGGSTDWTTLARLQVLLVEQLQNN